MATISVSFRISEELLARIDQATNNRSQFFVSAVEEKLSPVKAEELSDKEKRDVLKGAKTLNDLLKDAMMQRLAKDKNFLDHLDGVEFARLVAGRLPKEEGADAGLEQDVLSLSECIDMLPGIDDITRELCRVKGELFKVERERDINLKLLKHAENKVELGELMELVFRGAVEYAVDLVARNHLPGFGDGGGLSAKGYAEISDVVKKELQAMELHRK